MMMSSLTRPPESITFLAATPSGVPAFTAARSMSPVEICGMPNFLQMKAAWVPLPAPGAPNRISLIGFLVFVIVGTPALRLGVRLRTRLSRATLRDPDARPACS